ncbi:hypothetical protein JR316_0002774 [Psilocybe cubensis]|uniref:Uncharacterized protein n=2 Tax=Psilocybe cubensis TaxID=181762 RepID=A0ACB8HDF7_PSICU|nr:hypothetical protein JR316_0002774 [Psilocybe cubensis]KAH9485859.1 hypothetical protein JR316_0002774 [Psilocybe cubensis]
MAGVRVPSVLWAQGGHSTASGNGFIYLTVDLPGIIHSTLDYKVTKTSMFLTVDAMKSNDLSRYGFQIQFHGEVAPNGISVELKTRQSITFIIFKGGTTTHYWPQLSKDLLEYVKPDIVRWAWQDQPPDVDSGRLRCLTSVERLKSLGRALTERCQQSGNLQDIEWATLVLKVAAEFGTFPLIDRWLWFRKLAEVATLRFNQTGDIHHENSAIYYLNQALQCTPSGHVDLFSHLGTLGKLYLNRYIRGGNILDNETAISYLRQAVYPTVFSGDDLTPLNTAVDSFSKSVLNMNLVPVPSKYAGMLDDLANAYSYRFAHGAHISDIKSAIFYHQKAVYLTPSSCPDYPTLLKNLGTSYLRCFERTGNLTDVDFALHYHQRALNSNPDDPASLALFHLSLGNSYARRFERSGDMADINHGISHHEMALKIAPASHFCKADSLVGLGNSALRRFQKTGQRTDIESAITHHLKALEATPTGHADLPGRLSNLGNSYLYAYQQSGDPTDISSAILYHRRALEATPAGHMDRPVFLANIASSYSCRFSFTNDLSDIGHAISYQENVVGSTPADHVNLPEYLKNFGDFNVHRFKKTRSLADIRSAIAHYSRGARAMGLPATRLDCAKGAALISQVFDPSSSIPHYELLVRLLSEVAGIEQTIHHRHVNLHKYSNLLQCGVAAALNVSRFDTAVEWLEHGRCLVWNQIDELRTSVDRLRETNPSLADRFTKSAHLLEHLGVRSSIGPSLHETLEDGARSHDTTLLHSRTAAEYNAVLEVIRQMAGFEDFLQPCKIAKLLSTLPRDGPVILFNINGDRCDAMALLHGVNAPIHIPLKDFSQDKAKALYETLQVDALKNRSTGSENRGAAVSLDSSIRLILEVLWFNVVKPIFDVLAYTIPPKRSDRPRLWWCPSGPLSFLPLHAAGVYGPKEQISVADFVISSYTPTVRSLTEKFEKSSSGRCAKTSVLLVSQQWTPGLPSIPSTKTETQAIKSLLEKSGINTLLLENADATRDRVKNELDAHGWVHFACHGIQDPNNALSSGLCLHDGRLELLETMQKHTQNKRVAFLAACQTGTGDSKLSEEVVHIAAGMLATGYHGVVGTMWNISDKHGPLFAEEFYRYLLGRMGSNGLDGNLAAYALDHATSVVRQNLGNSELGLLKWVPYVHFGY